jgi:hypothetical protein
MNTPQQRGEIARILGTETTPIMQQLVARIEIRSKVSGEDQLAMITALQMAFAGANAAPIHPDISEWELPWGDQWARDHAQEGSSS